MENKTFTVCNIEKHINNFYKRHSDGNDCIIKRGVKRYFDNKSKISIQQKLYSEKNRVKLYKNKVVTETKETLILKNYIDAMLKLKTR